MSSYLIIKTNGNGYSCSCCRRTWKVHEEMDFEDNVAAKEYVKQYNKNYDKHDEEKDSKITNIYNINCELDI